MCSHIVEIDRIRTLYLLSYYLGSIFLFWHTIMIGLSFLERKRLKDYKKIKYLKSVAPIPYLIVTTVCSVGLALFFLMALFVGGSDGWNTVSISWLILAVCYILISINVYVNRETIVWAVKDDIWFARTWVMVVVGLFVLALFWLIWKWSEENISGPFVGTPEFELAVCYTAIIMLVYLFLKIKLASRKTSEIDVLIDEYVYKGKSKEDVYRQLRANQMGYGILEACSQELYALKSYSDKFEQQKERLDAVKASFNNGDIDNDTLTEQFDTLYKSMDYNDEWGSRVDALYDKVNEINKNVPELRSEEEFVNMLKIVGHMLSKGGEMNDKIKSVIDEIQKYMEEQKGKGQ